MSKSIVILCSLDSKGKEAAFLKDRIEAHGAKAILVDISIGGEPSITPDITSEDVAKAGGGNIFEIRATKDTGRVTPIMVKGASVKVLELHGEGRLDGVIAFGGASNTTAATAVMKTLPFGIPKFMVSSTASMPAYAASYIGTKDITMMHSVVDIAGLNDLSMAVLERAAGGVCGMADASKGAVKPMTSSPLIALTEFKFSDDCSQRVKDLLEGKGYNVIPFHAQGIGDAAMEELISQGLFDGVIDVVPAGVGEHLVGGNRDPGPSRLEAAGRMGIPQVIAPCGFDMISCGPLGRKDTNDPLWTKRRLAERKLFIPDEFRVQVRSSADELRGIAAAVADKLNRSKGPVVFLIPTRGWSSLSVEGADLYDPEADRVFVSELKGLIDGRIEVQDIDTDLNAPEFADRLVETLVALME